MQDEPRISGAKLLLVVLLIPALVAVLTIVPMLLHHRGPDVASPSSPAVPTQPPVATSVTAASTPSVTLAPPLPSPREGNAMAYDIRHDDVVLFGGGGGSDPSIADTWTLDVHGWHAQHPVQSPPPLGGPLMAEDAASGTVLLVGSFPAPADVTATTLETWSWDGRTWSRRSNLPGPHEAAIGLAALPRVREVVLLTSGLPPRAGAPPQILTWTWDGAKWSLQHPSTDFPAVGATPTLASDPSHGRVIALLMGTYSTDIQTWAWDGRTWSRLPTSASPTYDTITATMTPDPSTGDMILFVCGRFACETWALSGLTWHLVDRPSPDIDTAYHGALLLADTHIGHVIVVGREGPDRPNPLDTLWLFTGKRWTAAPPTALG